MPPTDDLTPLFRDARLLGEGTFGRVYRALDAEGRAVAVKVLAEHLEPQPDAVWQFSGEFRRLGRLHHPAFPAALAEGRTPQGRLYYSMALVEGEPPSGPQPAGRVRALLLAASDALAYLHGLGYVHGDLKPENMRSSDAGLHLLDLGLMAAVGQRRETIAGTVEYMAPELLRRAPVDPRSDLYALGALAFELWTGRPPFEGPPSDLVRAHLQAPPPEPPAAAEDPELAALIRALLAKDPAARPASARAVQRALGADVEVHEGGGLVGGAFLGREALLAAWQATLARPGVLRFGGPTGIGKSRALDELRLAAIMAGQAWIGAACTGEADGAAGPVRLVVRQALHLAGLTPAAATAAWLAGEVGPEFLELEPPARRALFHAGAAADLGAAAAALGGLAIGIDDWQMADAASRDFLAFLERAAGPAPLRFALALEPEGEGPPDALALAPLTDEQALALIESRLGGEVPGGLAEALLPVARGLPLVLDMMLEHLVTSGALTAGPAGWRYADGASALTGGLGAIFAARYRDLPEDARRLAAVAAVAAVAGEMPAPTLGAVCGLEHERLAAAVEALVREGVLVGAGGRVRLAMPGLAGAFLAPVPPEERAGWASALARATVGGAPLSALPTDALSRAARLALAGADDPLALALAGEAGRRSLALAANAEALALLTAACERLPPAAAPEERLGLLLPRAEAERYLDRLEEATEHYQEAARLAAAIGDGAGQARALVGHAKCRQLKGDYAGAIESLERASEVGDAPQRARAVLAASRVRLFQGHTGEAVASAETAVALARRAEARPLLAQALNWQGLLLMQEDLSRAGEALAMLAESLGLSRALGDRIGESQALDNTGNAHLGLGALAEAEAAFGQAAEAAFAAGAETEAISARVNQALAAAERGALSLAADLAEDVALRARRAGRKFPQAVALTVQGQVAWRRARPAEARRALDEALALAEAIENRLLEEHVRAYRLEAALALGEREAAARERDRLRSIVEATGHAEMRARLGCLEAELERQLGRPEAARRLAAPWRDSENRVVAHRARQILAAAAVALGEGDTAIALAEEAGAIARGWQSAWHEAWDLLLLARAQESIGAQAEARRLAEAILAMPAADPNPFATAGAARLAGERGAGSWVEGLGPEALAAHGLEGLEAAPRGAGGAIDPGVFAAWLEALTLEPDEHGLSQALLEGAMAMAGAERGYVLAYEGGRLRQAVTRALDYEAEVASGFSQSLAEEALFTGSPLYVTDAGADARWKEAQSVMALGLKTVICLPLGIPTRLLGVVYMDRQALDPLLSEGDMALLGAYATAAASAILRERARRDARSETARAEACAELGARLAAIADPARIRPALLASAIAATGADRACWLVEEGGSWRGTLGLTPGGAQAPCGPEAISQSIAGWVAERREGMCLLDAGAEDWQDRRSVMALGLKTVWCLPAPGGALLYLDTTRAVEGDPAATLATVEALLRYAAPLLEA